MIYDVREEIAALRQGDMNVETYYGKLKKLWGNEEAMSSSDLCDLGFQCKSTKCLNERKVLDKVMKFLMGLNDCYMQIRTQILAMEPLPSIEKVYSMVSRDEIQRGMKPATTEVSAMFTSNFGGNNQGGNKQAVKVNNQSGNQISGYTQPSKKWRALFCQHCQMPGHTKETCYKLHGYPPGHKFYKGPGNIGKNYKSAANNVVSEFNIAGQEGNDDSGCKEGVQMSSIHMTQEQLAKLMSFLRGSSSGNEHIAGITCISTICLSENLRIISSGATDHITPHSHILKDIKTLPTPISVIMPNGDRVPVTHAGTCDIGGNIILQGVLLVPKIKFNLISVSKFTHDSDFVVKFSNKGCHIQDLAGQIVGRVESLILIEISFSHLDIFICTFQSDFRRTWQYHPIADFYNFEIQKQVAHDNVKLGFCGINHLEKLKNMGVSTIEVPQSFGSNRDFMEYCDLFKPKGDAGSVKIKRPVIYQEDAAAILYSSGTTGTSKGVVLSHRNLIATVELFVRFEASKYDDELSSSNVYLASLPMFHIYGLSLFVLGLLSLGSHVVVMIKFNIDEALRSIDRFKVTHFPVVPPILSALTAKAKDGYTIRLRSLKQVCVGASVTPKKVIDDFVQALPQVDFIQAYGMTASSAVAMATCGFNTRNLCKYLSAGLLAPNMQTKVVDWVTGSLLSPGMTGELWLKGPGIMKAIDKRGWLQTGDIVFFDLDGYLHIVDRLKEIIKYKCFQVRVTIIHLQFIKHSFYPHLIADCTWDLEDALISHPQIDDAAVTAAKDELAGETPVAFVVRTQGSSLSQTAVMDYVAQKVAPCKKVRRVIFVDSIPTSPTGKILRRKLRSDLISKI
ncbi:hypothetical protein QQ045_020255 [Rhodiola kirilowii]